MFFEVTAAVRVILNDEKFGMLYGNDINIVRRRSGAWRQAVGTEFIGYLGEVT